jgi:FkbM family methyltransferase
MALNEQIALYSELQRVQKRTVVQKRVQRNANYRRQVRASAASQLRSRGAGNLRGRLAAFLDKAVLHRTGFHEELQGIVGQIVHAAKERSPEIRTAIRKGISADQWGAVLRVVLDSLHPYDAIAVLSEAYLIRELEDVDEKVLIGTGTRQSNMRIQAAAKEPWTYQWIRTGIARGEVLYDIGANIGAYTLIALARGARVVAFEPHHENFRELCRNVSLNELEAEATLIPLALSDGPAALRNPNFTGAAGQTMTLARSGGGAISIVAERLDELRRKMSLPLPNHIKIDVDAFELKVLQEQRRLSPGRVCARVW